MVFHDWLLSLSIIFSGFIYAVLCQYFIPFYYWIVVYCMDRSHFIYWLICWWTFGLFGYCQYCCSEDCCTHICLSPWFWLYLRVEFPSCVFNIVGANTGLFSQYALMNASLMTDDVDCLSCAYITELYNFLGEMLVQVFCPL